MLERRSSALLLLSLPFFCALVWRQRFVLDDAFISLRYAQHLVEGQGLVWNVGERVEGYTSFLWTLLLALPLGAGSDPIAFVYALGPILAAGTLGATFVLARGVLGSGARALLVTLMLGTNFTFLSFATGGLETGLLTLVLTALFAVSLRRAPLTNGRALLVSTLVAVALMLRLDALPAAGMAWAHAVVGVIVQRPARRVLMTRLAGLVVPGALLLAIWLGWKLSYYGDLLPNTYYAKVSDEPRWSPGLGFLATFFHSYWLWPAILPALLGAGTLAWRRRTESVPLVLALLSTYAYLASVGGDFMEFRFLLPTMPILFLLIGVGLFEVVRHPLVPFVGAGLVIAGSIRHALTFSFTDGIETVAGLASHLQPEGDNWIGIGQVLRRDLPEHSDVKIATTAAGALPYFAHLPAVDMLGLCDPWVARHGVELGLQIGHTRAAPMGYLLAQGVHIVFGHPLVSTEAVLPPGVEALPLEILKQFPYFVGLESVPPDARLIEIPIAGPSVVVAVNLVRHPLIDALVERGVWRSVALTP